MTMMCGEAIQAGIVIGRTLHQWLVSNLHIMDQMLGWWFGELTRWAQTLYLSSGQKYIVVIVQTWNSITSCVRFSMLALSTDLTCSQFT